MLDALDDLGFGLLAEAGEWGDLAGLAGGFEGFDPTSEGDEVGEIGIAQAYEFSFDVSLGGCEGGF